jgi:NADPH:quinone reductase-like Zn-dependent oxidoreductase
MKAVTCTTYGPLDGLRLEEIPRPTPKEDEVLVEVHASCVNFNNLAYVSGKPAFARLMGVGLFKPKCKRPGDDVAGRVAAVGRHVKQFRANDEVFGNLAWCGYGAFAEYVCVPEEAIALKPANATFEEAAAMVQAGAVALRALRDTGHIQAGQNVLIYGASGGIGSLAVQIAKAFGAEVTGVCSARNAEMVRSLGADHVIDYSKEDFVRNGRRYDLILATAGYRSIFDYRRALNPLGRYVATGGSMRGPKAMAQVLQAVVIGPWISRTGGRKLGISHLGKIDQRDLTLLKELVEAGKVRPHIDRSYRLSEVAEALKYYQAGHTVGKVVIRVEQQTGDQVNSAVG